MFKVPIDDRQIDVWYVVSNRITDRRLFDEYRDRLPREEVDEEQRFVFEKSRLQYLVTRMLVRSVLSHYTGDELGAWRFARNAYGKPSVVVPTGVPLGFNLSHTDGLVVCAVSSGYEIGVDAEVLSRVSDHLNVARHYFAPQEVAALEALPPGERATAFLRLWTLKEAFIKARGMGLSIPLDSFAFSLSADRAATISFSSPAEEFPGDWQFGELRLDSRYQVAIAARMPAGERFRLTVRETIPLRWQSDCRILPSTPSNEWSI